MKVANSFAEARQMIFDLAKPVRGPNGVIHLTPSIKIGVDIGKQFGTRVIMHLDTNMALTLLNKLEEEDCPLPQVIHYQNRILIGAEPE